MSKLVFARFSPNPGQEAAVEGILRGMIGSTRLEPGCQRYDFYRSLATSGTMFCLIEQYADDAAIQAHRDTPHYKNYRAKIADLLQRPVDVTVLEPLDERGAK